MENTSNGGGPKKRGSLVRALGLAVAALLLLLVVVYFVATSSGFFKSFILPKVAKSMNGDIQVQEASISPFSGVTLKGLRVTTTGKEPLVTAEEVRLRYSLMDIVKGNINVSEMTLVSPVIQLVTEADGSSNLDPLVKKSGPAQPAASGSSGQPPKLDIKNIAIQNGTFRQVEKQKDGGTNTTELKGLNLAIDKVHNGQTGKITLSTDLRMEATHPKGTNDVLAGKVQGTFDFGIDEKLQPQSIKGTTQLAFSQGAGAYRDAANMATALELDVTPKEIRQAGVRFEKAGSALGQLRVSGPFDLAKKEGKLKVEILAIDRQILNMAVASKGWDFGKTVINSTSNIELAQGASLVTVIGSLAARQMTIDQNKQVTPPVDLDLSYDVKVNLTEKTAVLQKVDLAGTQKGSPFLTTSLDRPMNFSWGTATAAMPDAALQFGLTNFNLADWKAVLGTNAPSGLLQTRLDLTSQKGGKLLKLALSTAIDQLATQVGTNQIADARVRFSAEGTVVEFKNVELNPIRFDLNQAGQAVVQGAGNVKYAVETKEASGQMSVEASLPGLAKLMPAAGLASSLGTLKITTTFTQSEKKQSASGNLQLANFTGSLAPYEFQAFQTTADYAVDVVDNVAQIKQATVSFAQGTEKGGTADLSGSYNIAKKSGQLAFKTVDLNQAALRPFLTPSLGGKKLVSVSLNSTGAVQMAENGDATVKADLGVSSLVTQEAESNQPSKPLSVQLALDLTKGKDTLDLRNLLLQLTATPKAQNKLQISGKLDMAKTNAAPSAITIQSEGLDVTPYYDMFAGGSAAAKAPAAPAPATPAASSPAPPAPATAQAEPAPIALPFQKMDLNLKIDRFYLREVAISNWVAAVKINGAEVTVKPFQLNLNGAPVSLSALANIGLPGYTYDVGFDADRIPLDPLMTSFSTNKSNPLHGFLVGHAKVKGAGVTGASLKKNLGGQVAFSVTNMNYMVLGPKLSAILYAISLPLSVPEITKSPLNWIDTQLDIASGFVNFTKFGAQSDALYATALGKITIDPILTNSPLELPLSIYLPRNLAMRTKLVPANSPTNAQFLQLPPFVTVRGTVGNPKSEIAINKMAVAEAALGTAGRFLGEKNGATLQSVANFLGGGTTTGVDTNGNQIVSTNAPASAKGDKVNNLIQGFGGLLKQGKEDPNKAATNLVNSAATNAVKTNKPAKLNPFDLLKGK